MEGWEGIRVVVGPHTSLIFRNYPANFNSPVSTLPRHSGSSYACHLRRSCQLGTHRQSLEGGETSREGEIHEEVGYLGDHKIMGSANPVMVQLSAAVELNRVCEAGKTMAMEAEE